MDDRGIIDLFFERSEEAITQLDRRYGAACRAMAKNILGSEADAEECVSDAYLAVWNAIPPQRPDHLGAWLFRVVRNLSASRYRSNTAARRNSFYDAALSELADVLAAPEGPEDTLAARELARHIDRFLSDLSEDDRAMFVRRYFYGDAVGSVAKALGVSENRVSVRLHRLRKKLRAYLTREGYIL